MTCANHPDREKVAFCQNCGKPLCQECMRAVGSAVFCEPCLAAKLAGAGAVPPAGGSYVYNDPASGVHASGSFAGGGAYSYTAPGVYAAGPIPPPSIPGRPNAWLAAFLGFIPGVGAMYNEQYAKGVVHLVVFALLVSLADSHDIFGLFVAGWEFYMAIEAYHTARARRDGHPLPNPFGLNDIGERLGFGKSWGTSHTPSPMPPDPYTAQYPNQYAAANPGPIPPSAPPYAPPTSNIYGAGTAAPNWSTPQTPGWEQSAPMPPVDPNVPLDAQVPYPGNRFPAGAFWLIGFGVLFLITNAGIFHGFSARLFVPIFMIGLAVFIFVRKMTSLGAGLSADGSPTYRLRVFRALRGSIWVALVGLLFFLDEFGILTWGHSWPLFIIVAGVMTVLERAAYTAAAPPLYGSAYPGYGYPPAPAATPEPASATSIVPARDFSERKEES